MTSKDNGGPAFPRPRTYNSSTPAQDGMTLRDYFAGQALPWTARTAMEFSTLEASPARTAARMAYEVADAMLAERAK